MSTLATLDTESLRRKLAGLADPLSSTPGKTEKAEIRDAAIRFCSILARLFGDNLKRETLWERIGSALEVALAKVSDDDLDAFTGLCLDHIQAEDSQVAACEPLSQMLATFQARPEEWRYALLSHFRSHRHAAIVHGRARWEQVKAKAVEL